MLRRRPPPNVWTLPLLYDETQFARLLLESTPLVDVRAPCEFADGSIPGAVNLPLLDDQQRHEIGTCFKKEGQAAALELGHSRIGGEVRTARLEKWRDFVTTHPHATFYCARGGLRSQLVVRALREEFGLAVPMIKGGYKAARQFLLNVNAHVPLTERFLVVTGRTGCGKTKMLEHLAPSQRVLDLEGLAHHRGSAFGRRRRGQPRSAEFENGIAAELLRLQQKNGAEVAIPKDNSGSQPILVEDESRLIGHLTVPPQIFEKIQTSDMVLIEEDDQSRVEFLLKMYLTQDYLFDDQPSEIVLEETDRLALELRRALQSIAKRLGGSRTQECSVLLEKGLAHQRSTSSTDEHRPWILYLLKNYYDPMYDSHIEANRSRIRFRGSRQEVLAFLS